MEQVEPSRYREWIDFHFGRSFDDPWDVEWEFDATPDEKAALFVATMTRGRTDLAGYSDDKVGAGLQALLMGLLSDVPHKICSSSGAAKVAVIASLTDLYATLLSLRAPPVLGHLNEGDNRRLSFVTYMTWDETPLSSLIGLRGEDGRQSLLVQALKDALLTKPANPAVIEGILHGFGHMVGSHPRQADEICAAIDEFLQTRPIVRPELATYAGRAKTGYIL